MLGWYVLDSIINRYTLTWVGYFHISYKRVQIRESSTHNNRSTNRLISKLSNVELQTSLNEDVRLLEGCGGIQKGLYLNRAWSTLEDNTLSFTSYVIPIFIAVMEMNNRTLTSLIIAILQQHNNYWFYRERARETHVGVIRIGKLQRAIFDKSQTNLLCCYINTGTALNMSVIISGLSWLTVSPARPPIRGGPAPLIRALCPHLWWARRL